MQKKRLFQNVAIIVLAVAIIAMSVGYAVYVTPLEIKGTTTIQKASWEVHFANPTKLPTTTIGDSSITGPTLTNGSTSLTFGASLALGDTYEFTVDIENTGTLPAELTSFSLMGTKGEETVLNSSSGLSYDSSYLKYNVTYADDTALAINDRIEIGTKRTLKISVRFVQPDDVTKLPTESEEYVFTLNLGFKQA